MIQMIRDRWIYGPLLIREMKGKTGIEFYFWRSVMVFLMGATLIGSAAAVVGKEGATRTEFSARDVRIFGERVLIAMVLVQVAAIAWMVPRRVSGTIAREREMDTLPFLTMTRLTALEIVLYKTIGRCLPAMAVIAASMPLIAIAAFLSGRSLAIAAEIFLGLMSTTLAMGSLSIWVSSRSEKAEGARVGALLMTLAWLIGPSSIGVGPPFRASWVLPEIGDAIRTLCRLVGLSSPLSIVIDSLVGPPLGPFEFQIRIMAMLAGQAVLIVLAILSATSMLARTKPDPASQNAAPLVVRPPCGDDPIYWREYLLPRRGGDLVTPGDWFRVLSILFRFYLKYITRAALQVAWGLIPIVLISYAIQYVILAYRESHANLATHAARDGLNRQLMWISTGFVIFSMLRGATIVESFKQERARGTWLILLATPLTGEEILGAKRRVGRSLIIGMMYPIVFLGFVGTFCDAFTTMGTVLSAVNWASAVVFSEAVGIRQGVRADSSSSFSRSQDRAMAFLGILLPFLIAILASILGSFRAPARVAICLGSLVVDAALVWASVLIARETIRRFDEWVGRPFRGEKVVAGGEGGNDR